MTPPTETGVCRVCQQRKPLTDDGRLAPHGNPIAPAIECDGTGRLPDAAWSTR